jgi:NAD(P)-dependent dehydrogenase (short-subunit alcohol dehydrogenase family)
VFVRRSGRFTDPRADLLSGTSWTTARAGICAGLNLPTNPARALEQLGEHLDSAYRETAARLDENTALAIATIAGADRPDLSKLDALEEPAELSRLREVVDGMLPTRVPFSEVLLEVCSWTGFAEGFTHLSERQTRTMDLHASVCAVLFAEACNIALSEVAHPSIPALGYSRLSWVEQNYVRAETIAAANERLLDAYRKIPLVQVLGDGHIATVVRTNLTAAMYTTRAALPGMYERGWGRIVNLTSIGAQTGYAGTAAYAASKAGSSA